MDSLRGLRIWPAQGILCWRPGCGNGPTPLMQQVKQFQALGAEVKEISLPNAELAIPAYYVVAPS